MTFIVVRFVDYSDCVAIIPDNWICHGDNIVDVQSFSKGEKKICFYPPLPCNLKKLATNREAVGIRWKQYNISICKLAGQFLLSDIF